MRREHWISELGLIMALAGSTIGLGALWRVHGCVISGGAVFVWSYILFSLLFAFPIFILESLLGRYTSQASVKAFYKTTKSWLIRPGGIFHVISAFITVTLFIALSGYFLTYFLYELFGWVSLENPRQAVTLWNQISHSYFWSSMPAFAILLASAYVLYHGVGGGIEKWSKRLMPIFFVFLSFMAIVTVFNPHIREVCSLLFIPKYSQFNVSTLITALEMAFFTVSAGQGVLISYSSYMGKRGALLKVAFITVIVSSIVPVISSLIVFTAAFQGGITITTGDSTVVFKILPLLFRDFHFSYCFSVMFLSLFVFAALTTVIALMEAMVSNAMECFSWSRKKAVIFTSIFLFCAAVPLSLSYIIEWDGIELGNKILTPVLLIAVLLTSVLVGWIIPHKDIHKEFSSGSSSYVSFYDSWFRTVRYIVPVVISILLVCSVI